MLLSKGSADPALGSAAASLKDSSLCVYASHCVSAAASLFVRSFLLLDGEIEARASPLDRAGLRRSGAVPWMGCVRASDSCLPLGCFCLTRRGGARHLVPALPAHHLRRDEVDQADFDHGRGSPPPGAGRAVARTLPFARLRASFRPRFANRTGILRYSGLYPPESRTARVGCEA